MLEVGFASMDQLIRQNASETSLDIVTKLNQQIDASCRALSGQLEQVHIKIDQLEGIHNATYTNNSRLFRILISIATVTLFALIVFLGLYWFKTL